MKNMNKYIWILITVVVVGWVVFRFSAIGSEHARAVFNADRIAIESGAPVDVIVVGKGTGVLREPIHVKNNRALVSGNRVGKFAAGQKIGNGKIVSVAQRIDLDSGMYVIRTSGVADGLNYAESAAVGYYVPVYAINNSTVMVAENGNAVARTVKIANQDSDNALIVGGLSDGDIVILSHVDAGERVKITNK